VASLDRSAVLNPLLIEQNAEWTIERIGREAAAIGPSTAKLADFSSQRSAETSAIT